jgi:hypothetical protein
MITAAAEAAQASTPLWQTLLVSGLAGILGGLVATGGALALDKRVHARWAADLALEKKRRLEPERLDMFVQLSAAFRLFQERYVGWATARQFDSEQVVTDARRSLEDELADVRVVASPQLKALLDETHQQLLECMGLYNHWHLRKGTTGSGDDEIANSALSTGIELTKLREALVQQLNVELGLWGDPPEA